MKQVEHLLSPVQTRWLLHDHLKELTFRVKHFAPQSGGGDDSSSDTAEYSPASEQTLVLEMLSTLRCFCEVISFSATVSGSSDTDVTTSFEAREAPVPFVKYPRHGWILVHTQSPFLALEMRK